MSRKRKPIKKTLVDIALLTCGLVEEDVLNKCTEAIASEMRTVECQFHVILNGVSKEDKQKVDNAIQKVDNAETHAKIHYSNVRLGFSAAANRVIRKGASPLILFITDDIILHEGALINLVNRMDDPEIGLCGLKLIFPKDSTDTNRPAGRVQHIGHAIDTRGEITHPLMGWSPENPRCNVSREVQSVTGGVFMVRRNLFLKSGGFFEAYGVGYYEDVDLCFSIRSLGAKVFIDTNCVADHVTNASYNKAGVTVPMETNKMIFRSRWSKAMQNDSFSFW